MLLIHERRSAYEAFAQDGCCIRVVDEFGPRLKAVGVSDGFAGA